MAVHRTGQADRRAAAARAGQLHRAGPLPRPRLLVDAARGRHALGAAAAKQLRLPLLAVLVLAGRFGFSARVAQRPERSDANVPLSFLSCLLIKPTPAAYPSRR